LDDGLPFTVAVERAFTSTNRLLLESERIPTEYSGATAAVVIIRQGEGTRLRGRV
jgi:hypothetical protein